MNVIAVEPDTSAAPAQEKSLLDSRLRDKPAARWAVAAFSVLLTGGLGFIVLRLSRDLSSVHQAHRARVRVRQWFSRYGERRRNGDLYAFLGAARRRGLVGALELHRRYRQFRLSCLFDCGHSAGRTDPQGLKRVRVHHGVCVADRSRGLEPCDLVARPARFVFTHNDRLHSGCEPGECRDARSPVAFRRGLGAGA